jgi:hypothetical protein
MEEPQTVPGRRDGWTHYRAFLETVALLRPRLRRYCARMTGSTMDGEDVVQAALVDAHRRACVLLKDVFDCTIEEIADLVASTMRGVKAALHRRGEKLSALPPPAPSQSARELAEDTERLRRLYVERFNQRDWDGLRALIAADATLRVADWFEGPLRESPYTHCPWIVAAAEHVSPIRART